LVLVVIIIYLYYLIILLILKLVETILLHRCVHTNRLLHAHWLLHAYRLLHTNWLLHSHWLLHANRRLHSHWLLHAHRCLHSNWLIHHSWSLHHSLWEILKLFHHVYFLKVDLFNINLLPNRLICLPNIHFDSTRFTRSRISWIYLFLVLILLL